MVVGKSPDWLPPGFIEKVKYKNGRKIKYYVNVAKDVKYYSKQEVIRATENNGAIGTFQKENGDEHCLSTDNQVEDCGVIVTPQKENGDGSGPSIDNKVDVASIEANASPAWLPNGWKMEERTRHSGASKGSVYKIYSDLSSGRKFYSKAAVARYLNTLDHANTMTVQNKIDNVDKPNVDELSMNEPNVDEPSTVMPLQLVSNEPSVDEPSTVMSLQLVSMTNTSDISNVNDKPNVDVASIDTSRQLVSMTNTGGANKMKRKYSSFTTVATECSTDADLPPGWTKEIKISKSGRKMRRDPYYTDPVSGYIFRSKKDVMRYLETNDIRQCASKPLKRELDDIKLIKNEIPSSNPANEKSPGHNRLGGELNGGDEHPGTKTIAESETNIINNVEVEEKILRENSEKNAEIMHNPTPESDSKEISGSGSMARTNSSKSKKRKGLSLPSRNSKRLAGSQPEIVPNVNLTEHSLRAAAKSSFKVPNLTLQEASASTSASASVPPPPSDIEQSKAISEEAFRDDEAQQDRLREIVENLFNDVEEPPKEDPPNPAVESGGEKQIDESKITQESQLCCDFGDSWSDPLEFAFKTLMGEISIDDPLTFPSCFSEQDNAPQNQADECFKQSDVPQNEFAARAESSKQVGPGLSSLSPLGDIGFAGPFGGLNCQSGNEVGKKDFQTKFKP